MTYRDPMIRLTVNESIKFVLDILKQRFINCVDSSMASCSGTDDVVHTNSISDDIASDIEQPRLKR